MPVPEITAFFAGVLGLMAIGLGATAGLYRAKNEISLGDGGDPALLLGRALHWIGFNENARNPLRGLGAGLTTLSIAVAAIWNIVSFV